MVCFLSLPSSLSPGEEEKEEGKQPLAEAATEPLPYLPVVRLSVGLFLTSFPRTGPFSFRGRRAKIWWWRIPSKCGRRMPSSPLPRKCRNLLICTSQLSFSFLFLYKKFSFSAILKQLGLVWGYSCEKELDMIEIHSFLGFCLVNQQCLSWYLIIDIILTENFSLSVLCRFLMNLHFSSGKEEGVGRSSLSSLFSSLYWSYSAGLWS